MMTEEAMALGLNGAAISGARSVAIGHGRLFSVAFAMQRHIRLSTRASKMFGVMIIALL